MTDRTGSLERREASRLAGARRWILTSLLCAIGGTGIFAGQSMLIRDGMSVPALASYVLGVLAVLVVAWPFLAQMAGAVPGQLARTADLPAPLWLGGAGLACAAIAFGRAWGRTRNDATQDIAAFWILGMVLVLLAGAGGTLPRRWRDIARAQTRTWPGSWPWPTIAAALVITLAAAGARLIMLNRFATIFDSDEAFFALPARQARNGALPNPFQTSFFAVPDLYLAAEGWLSRPFPDEIAAYRLVSALCGIVTVYVTWRLGRRMFGTGIGLTGAAILAFMPLHLWASRTALNNVFDSCVLSVAMLCMDRAISTRSRTGALLSGLAMGFGFYGYYGARIFPVIVLAWMVVAVFLPGTRLPVAQLMRLAAWMLAGVFTAAAPILGYYGAHPDVFMSRMRIVALTEHDAPPSLVDRIVQLPGGLLYPFLDQANGFTGGFYRQGPPFLGWVLAPLVAIGGVTWIVWFVHGLTDARPGKPRPAGLLIAWLIVCAGISQTANMQSQRFLAVSFVWALAAGTGIMVLAMLLRAVVRLPEWSLRLGIGIAVTGIALVHANLYFSEDQQITAYIDRRTTAAYDIAWRIQHLPAQPDFLLAGTEYLSYKGFGNWQFMNPGLQSHITELPKFARIPDDVPKLASNQLLILAGERPAAEQCALQTRNPTAHIGQARNRYGTLLYTVVSTGADLGLPLTETPAQTTLVPVETSLCQESHA